MIGDIAAVLHYYGAQSVPEGGWRKMRCPFKQFHDDHRASGSVNTREGVYKCFACGVQGDAIAVIQKVDDGCPTFESAVSRYQEITGESHPELSGSACRQRNGEVSDGGTWDSFRGRGAFSAWVREHSGEGS